jgi:oxygen-dependent protoporphyrinogen oxidase
MSSRRAVIVGGGIAGLSAAFDLHRAGWHVTVHEASSTWGGKVQTSPVGDRPVDAGPDAFLARVPYGLQLCQDLHLDDELTSPVSPVPAYVHADGQLHELPAGTMLGVPTDLDQLAASALISVAGIERAAKDLELPPSETAPDPSVGAICRARLGDEVTDRLIDPLVGAINASDIDRLSLAAAAPQLAGALAAEGSLIKGMAAFRAASGAALGSRDPNAPVFYGIPGGVARIIDRLVEELAGADLRLNSPITDLRQVEDGDAVLIAAPAFVAASLFGAESDAGSALASIDYADVSQVVVELPVSGVERVLDASGILFPRVEGKLMTACTWLSTKWDHYRTPSSVLIRLSSGRFGDTRHTELNDAELAAALLAELATVIDVTEPPIATRVKRWPQAFPQYTPGHRDRVAAARAAVAEQHPGVSLIGAAYGGIGVPACIDAGRTTATELIES